MMKSVKNVVAALAFGAGLSGGAVAALADELCTALADTALFADAGLTEEVRPVFQFDGAQFVPSQKDGEAMFGMAYDVRMDQMLEEPSYVRASDWQCEVFEDASADTAAASSAGAGRSFDMSPQACAQEISDTRMVVSDASLGFYESSCDIAEKRIDGASEVLTLLCYGEGEEWQSEVKLTYEGDAAVVVEHDGLTQSYVACAG